MPTPDPMSLAARLVEGLHEPRADRRLRDATVPLSAITATVRAAFETSRFFPPGARPEQLGDGALIERRGRHHFRVYERFEIGQLRYSDLSARSHLFLRRAVIGYLSHYAALLRVDRVRIRRWS